jgi:hypothetical protein
MMKVPLAIIAVMVLCTCKPTHRGEALKALEPMTAAEFAELAVGWTKCDEKQCSPGEVCIRSNGLDLCYLPCRVDRDCINEYRCHCISQWRERSPAGCTFTVSHAPEAVCLDLKAYD